MSTYKRPSPVAPVRKKEAAPFDGWQETHPSYGMIGFSRTSGRVRLFGSGLPHHDTFITLRIHTATRRFSYGTEKASAAGGKQLIEVNLSSVQFAKLLTEMNMGDGTACTLRYVNGEEMPEVPELAPELHEATEEVREKVAAIRTNAHERVAKVRELLTGKVPKKVQEAVEGVLTSFLNEVTGSLPFWAQRIDESAERASAAAMAEVDAYVSSAVHKAGIAALGDPDLMRRLLADREGEK